MAVSGYERLPEWLHYDPSTRTLFGSPGSGDAGEFDVIVQGIDSRGAERLAVFRVTVQGPHQDTDQDTNHAPEVGTRLADQRVTGGAPFFFFVPRDAFTDADADDMLSLTATGAGGSPLPAWLTFNPVLGTFSGVPFCEDAGSVALEVTATDNSGAQASQTFVVSVDDGCSTPEVGHEGNPQDANHAPEVGTRLADQRVTGGAPFFFFVPRDAFTDADADDMLSLTATGAGGSPLPAWLTFNPVLGTFSGVPFCEDAGSVALEVTATDNSGAQASQTFTVSVDDGCGTPEVVAPPHPFSRSVLGVERIAIASQWSALARAVAQLDAGGETTPALHPEHQGADLSGLTGSMLGSGHVRGGADRVLQACGTAPLQVFSGPREEMSSLLG